MKLNGVKIFIKAFSVWERATRNEMNYELSFKTVIGKHSNTFFKVASSCNYRLWVNGNFVAFGPARAAKGYFKVDKISLDAYLKAEKNVIVLDVYGANVNSYYVQDQPSFVTAEIIADGQCIAWTGRNGNIFGYNLNTRVQKSQRYTGQRTFTEVYRLNNSLQDFYVYEAANMKQAELEEVSAGEYLERDIRYPQYTYSGDGKAIEKGKVDFAYGCTNPVFPNAYKNICDTRKGFLPEELDEPLSDEVQQFGYFEQKSITENLDEITLENEYVTLELPFNISGFVRMNICCTEDSTIYVLFDETLTDGDVDFLRLGCSCLKYYLEAGNYELQSFEPYTMKYLKVIVKGKATISKVGVLQYKHEEPKFQVALPQDASLQKIYHAAVETYLANAVDNFYDCPSRERAGWLCDSFFTARVEKILTGENVMEKAFLKNFVMAGHFPHLPEGMLPMCYPADFYTGIFIPNWAMWYVLELEEYFERSGDREFVNSAKGIVDGLIRYFDKYLNEKGLLERLESWVFVEWSKANDWVQDVSFPSNMLYARMLEAAGRLYMDDSLIQRSNGMRNIIRDRSFNGTFFTDHEVITENGYENPGDCSEVCQYYAFFTGTATIETYPQLWKILSEEFGPGRHETGLYPEIPFTNAFIGDYLRLEILYKNHQYEEVLRDMKAYFEPMAEQTGTLWEGHQHGKSKCHGFASHVIYWLAGMFSVTERRSV